MNNGEYNLSDIIDVMEEVLASGGEFRIYPKGTSMLPLIRQGRDSVVLKRDFESAAKKHDIAFYRRDNGAFVLHRVMRVAKDGTYVMCGDNQTALESGIKKEQIIAHVITVYRENKAVPTGKLKYRFYVFVWCIIPYRRFARFCGSAWRSVKRRLGRNKK